MTIRPIIGKGEQTVTACNRQCDSQCDGCHTLDNCVEATQQYGDLILCEVCRQKYPAQQPWRLDPETGEYIDLHPQRIRKVIG